MPNALSWGGCCAVSGSILLETWLALMGERRGFMSGRSWAPRIFGIAFAFFSVIIMAACARSLSIAPFWCAGVSAPQSAFWPLVCTLSLVHCVLVWRVSLRQSPSVGLLAAAPRASHACMPLQRLALGCLHAC